MEYTLPQEWNKLHQALVPHLPPSLMGDLVLDDHVSLPLLLPGDEEGMDQNMAHHIYGSKKHYDEYL